MYGEKVYRQLTISSEYLDRASLLKAEFNVAKRTYKSKLDVARDLVDAGAWSDHKDIGESIQGYIAQEWDAIRIKIDQDMRDLQIAHAREIIEKVRFACRDESIQLGLKEGRPVLLFNKEILSESDIELSNEVRKEIETLSVHLDPSLRGVFQKFIGLSIYRRSDAMDFMQQMNADEVDLEREVIEGSYGLAHEQHLRQRFA